MTTIKKFSSLALIFSLVTIASHAQPGSSVDLKKPQEYENRTLRSEKSSEKKLTTPKRILQNTFTHYNYFFNANNKMNEVIERAKAAFKDDYTRLLPFYPYSLDATAQQKGDIDSVIYKCTAGILLHDLRNDWIDNLYLLLGKAYMFRKDFDSASQTFQYINYAYAPKDDGYDVAIGSNASNTNGVFTIASKESNNLLKKAVTHPPSRNESFIWQARNFVEQGELSDASGLIEILRADPNFPKRLKTELYEVLSYWFYHQQAYDSSAFYLGKALSEADTRQDKARWEYLIGQLYGLAGNNEFAVKYFERAISHTTDPVMEVYARLNALRINNSGKKDSYIQDNLNDLLKMAKKDKYENYKDIIYYTAAQVELERKNTEGAIKWLKKSVEASQNNPKQKAEAFLLLADLTYNSKSYTSSSNYYDSTAIESLSLEKDKARVTDRRPALKTISTNIQNIQTQDSLQRIAGMPEAEREALIRRLVKQLRKAKGLKEDPAPGGGSSGSSGDLFSDSKGDWYFSNPNLKAKGFSEFKSRWGNRPNVDNWRRQQALDRAAARKDVNVIPGNDVAVDSAKDEDVSYESLFAKLPLTPEKIEASNKIIQASFNENGNTFQDKLEDHQSAIETYEELLRRFPAYSGKEQVLFNLIYLYGKVNDLNKQAATRQLLLKEFPNGKYTKIITQSTSTGSGKKSDAATAKYEQIYKLFIEGKFSQAIEEKQNADKEYGNSYWTPQLLFIESIYYIKQQQDSTAINRLTAIKTQFASSPLAEKAVRMIDVLSRRKEIEDYLTNLDVQRKENEQVKRVDMVTDQNTATKPVELPTDVSKKTVAAEKPVNIKIDSSVSVKPNIPANNISKSFIFDAADKHFAVVLLDNVDVMYAGEVKNAFNRWNSERYFSYRLNTTSQPLSEKYQLVMIGPFKDAATAVDYVEKTRPQAAGSILPWLSADKFSFLIINNANLELLKENKDVPAYKKMLSDTLPGKF